MPVPTYPDPSYSFCDILNRPGRARHFGGTMQDNSAPIEALLAHTDWLYALSARLVNDPSLADDVAQNTLAEAIARPPREATNPRAWLATVARNAVRQIRRSEKRRGARERAWSKEEATSSTLDVVAKANLQRDLVGEVVALPEPYRTTLLLHFFDGLETRQLATRMDCPVETVRTRLRRGLEQLRTRLDSRYGERESWGALLMPLAAKFQPTATLGIGAGLVASFMLALTVAAVLFWWPGESEDEGPNSEGDLIALQLPGSTEDNSTETAESTTAERTTPKPLSEVENLSPSDESDQAPVEDWIEESGRIFDVEGTPLAGFEFEYAEDRYTTDAEGRFVVRVREFPGDGFEAVSPDWVFALHRRLGPEPDAEQVLVAARARRVSGVVLGEDDLSLADVYVYSLGGVARLPRFPHILYGPNNGLNKSERQTRSDSDGRFSLEGVPDLSTWFIGASRTAPIQTTTVEAGSGDVDDLVLRLTETKPNPDKAVIEGVVLDTRGAPVDRAEVRFAWHTTQTDHLGRYQLSADNAGRRGYPLVAFKAGLGMAVLRDYSNLVELSPRPVHSADLVLSGVSLSMPVRVLDPSGASTSGFQVQLVDGTPTGGSSRFVEEELGSYSMQTDREGRTKIDGLQDRAYTFLAWHRDGRVVRSESTRPSANGDEELTLRVAPNSIHSNFEGRIVDPEGDPVPGVTITVMIPTFDGQAVGIEDGSRSSTGTGLTAVSDSEGRFVLDRIPRKHANLSLDADFIESRSAPLPTHPERIAEFEVQVLCRYLIHADGLEPGDRLTFMDNQGKSVFISYATGSASTITSRVKYEGEALPILSVPSRGVVLEVSRGRAILRTLPLDPRPGELTTLIP